MRPEKSMGPAVALIAGAVFIMLIQVVLSEIILSDFSIQVQHQRQSSVSLMVSLAYNNIEPVVEQYKQQKISKEQAVDNIRDIIRKMTYKDDYGPNYIFMSSYEGIMLVQPFDPGKEGTDQWDLKDSEGRFIIRELVKAAKERPEGSFVSYSYYPPEKENAEEKLSYVVGIPEIGAYIGTGTYEDSSYKHIKKILTRDRYIYLAGILSIILMMIFYIKDQFRRNKLLSQEIAERIQAENNIMMVYQELATTEAELRDNYFNLEAAKKEVEKTNERYSLIVEGSNDIICDWDMIKNNIVISGRFYEILGYERDEFEATYEKWLELMHPDDAKVMANIYVYARNDNNSRSSYEYRLRTKNGEYRWFLASGKIISNADGRVVRYAGSLTDITEKKKQEETIRHMAYYDYLTGLPNRLNLLDSIQLALETAKAKDSIGAIMFMDMDNFKIINDSFGHSFGDMLIKEIAKKIKGSVSDKSESLVARLGGDEFVVLVKNLEQEKIISQLAASLLDTFKEPIYIKEHSFHISMSIGISVFPRDGVEVDELLKNADMALYKAKEEGKGRFRYYTGSMTEQFATKMELENHLREAISRGELELYYQPQISMESGKITGFEALLRWFNPNFGMVPPDRFIPIAEETGLIVSLGKWAMEKAFEFSRELNMLNIEKMCVSINVSPIQLMQENFIDSLSAAVETYQVEASNIAIEITETALIESFGAIVSKLETLKQMGFRIYLDDFGTGYSSLNYLKNLPFDAVKIDRSFVSGILNKGMESRLVSSIITLAHSIGLYVVAEGVEKPEELEFLSASQCNYYQGYLFSRPVPQPEAITLLQNS